MTCLSTLIAGHLGLVGTPVVITLMGCAFLRTYTETTARGRSASWDTLHIC